MADDRVHGPGERSRNAIGGVIGLRRPGGFFLPFALVGAITLGAHCPGLAHASRLDAIERLIQALKPRSAPHSPKPGTPHPHPHQVPDQAGPTIPTGPLIQIGNNTYRRYITNCRSRETSDEHHEFMIETRMSTPVHSEPDGSSAVVFTLEKGMHPAVIADFKSHASRECFARVTITDEGGKEGRTGYVNTGLVSIYIKDAGKAAD